MSFKDDVNGFIELMTKIVKDTVNPGDPDFGTTKVGELELDKLRTAMETIDSDSQEKLQDYIKGLYQIDTNLGSFFSNITTTIKDDTTKVSINKFKITLFKLQKNIILLYIKENTKECHDIINKLLLLTNHKIDIVNQMLSTNLDSSFVSNISADIDKNLRQIVEEIKNGGDIEEILTRNNGIMLSILDRILTGSSFTGGSKSMKTTNNKFYKLKGGANISKTKKQKIENAYETANRSKPKEEDLKSINGSKNLLIYIDALYDAYIINIDTLIIEYGELNDKYKYDDDNKIRREVESYKEKIQSDKTKLKLGDPLPTLTDKDKVIEYIAHLNDSILKLSKYSEQIKEVNKRFQNIMIEDRTIGLETSNITTAEEKKKIAEKNLKELEEKAKTDPTNTELIQEITAAKEEVEKAKVTLEEVKVEETTKITKPSDVDTSLKLTSDYLTDDTPEEIIKKLGLTSSTIGVNVSKPEENRGKFLEFVKPIFEDQTGESFHLGGSKIINLKNIVLRGGNVKDAKDILIYIFKLNNIYNIFNSDLMITIISLLSHKNIFIAEINQILIGKCTAFDFVNLLFIDITNIKIIIEKITDRDKSFPQKIKRDTDFYNSYIPNTNKQYIFGYTILNIIYNIFVNKPDEDNVNNFFTNNKNLIEISNLFTSLYSRIKKISEIYNILFDQYLKISYALHNIINANKKVHTIVKIRQEDQLPNIRFTIKTNNVPDNYDNYINIKYTNTDLIYRYDPENPGNEGWIDDSVSSIRTIPDPEYYVMGPYDKIFDKSVTNEDIMKDKKILKMIEKILEKDNNTCLITYGKSGSGKTSTFIYLDEYDFKDPVTQEMKHVDAQDGLIMLICTRNIFMQKIDNIKLSICEVYLYHSEQVSQTFDTKYYRKIEDYKNVSFVPYGPSWKIEDSSINQEYIIVENREQYRGKNLSQFINEVFKDKITEPTSNNQNSSRSHIIIKLELYKNGKLQSNIIICDFAGVENKFECTNLDEIIKLYTNYMSSNKYKGNANQIKYDKYICSDGKFKYKEGLREPPKKLTNLSCVDQPDNQCNYDKNIYQTYKDRMGSNLNASVDDYIAYLDNQISIFGGAGARHEAETEKLTRDFPSYLKYETLRQLFILKLILHSPDINGFISKYNEYIDKIPVTSLYKINDQNLESFKNIFKVNNDAGKTYYVFNDAETKIVSMQTNPGNIYKKLKDSTTPGELYSIIQEHLKQITRSNSSFNHKDSNENSFQLKITDLDKSPHQLLYRLFVNGNPFGEAPQFSQGSQNDSESKKYKCEKDIIIKMAHNCNIRVYEGYMINSFLKGIKNDIDNLIKKSLEKTMNSGSISSGPNRSTMIPIIYEKQSYPYCRNNSLDYQSYDSFYNINSQTEKGFLFTILEQMKIDTNKLEFYVFTLINLNQNVDNPPTPPYINLNNFISYTKNPEDNIKINKKISDTIIASRSENIDVDIQTIRQLSYEETINNLLAILKPYKFYRESRLYNFFDKRKEVYTKLVVGLREFINEIYNNNLLTLIGSLQSTNDFQNISPFDNTCSFNKDIPEYHSNDDEQKFFRLRRSDNISSNVFKKLFPPEKPQMIISNRTQYREPEQLLPPPPPPPQQGRPQARTPSQQQGRPQARTPQQQGRPQPRGRG